MILILTRKDDEHADAVIKRLEQKGASYIRFETETLPAKSRLSVEYFKSNPKIWLSIGHNTHELSQIKTVWYRRPGLPEPSTSLSNEDRDFAFRESRYLLNSLWHLLGDRFWVNPYMEDAAADRKPYQLQLARELGFDIPRTLITNDPCRVMRFFEDCEENMIYKSLTSYARNMNRRLSGIFTSRVTRDELTSRLDQVGLGPCIFQEYVPKKSEIRITVMGRRIFAAEIDTQSHDESKDDWRKRIVYKMNHSALSLPAVVETKIRALIDKLGLVFGCVDIVRTPDDRYVFLEINPNGQWLWIEEITGLPMVEAFTDMLIQCTTSYLDSVSPQHTSSKWAELQAS